MSSDLERINRWVGAGGHADWLPSAGNAGIISLRRCDGGEEMDRFTSAEADVRDWFAQREDDF